MNAQQLKNAILQEAIEGRLVPQDSNDEPASVLLARIRKEKEQLVKEGKLKKKDLEVKPISEDDIPFETPDSWEWVRLGYITKYRRGSFPQPYTDSSSYGGDNSMPFVQVADVDENHYKLKDHTKKTISVKAMPYSVFVPTGTVLVTLQGSIGKVAITQYDSYVDRTLAIFERIYGGIDKTFFAIILKNKFELEALSARGETIKTITKEEFQEFFLPLPPLAEQHRIVAKIEELLPKVEEYGKAQDALNKLNAELPERLKKSILQEAIEGRLVPQDPNDEPASILLDKIRQEKAQLVKAGKLKKKDLIETPITEDEIPFEIPDSWEWVRIEFLFNHSSGKQLSGADTEGTLKEYITTSNLYWNRFELDNLKSMYYKDSELERCTARKGDLLVCEGGDVGRSAIWPYNFDICLQNHVHRLRPYYEGYTRYVYYVMWFYKSIGEIGGKGIGIKGLSASALKSIVIPLPPLAEQHRIVEKLKLLIGKIDKIKK